jgi:hypothetical protein
MYLLGFDSEQLCYAVDDDGWSPCNGGTLFGDSPSYSYVMVSCL